METKIIAISGKKQSGKSTLCNFIIGHSMKSLNIINKEFKITGDGKLYISDLFGDDKYAGVFDVTRKNTAMKDFLAANLDKYVKLYSFADELKRVCIELLGLDPKMVYGSDDDKNKETHLKWEDWPLKTKKKGFMTAREVMEVVGTDFFRAFYEPVWVKNTIYRIHNDSPTLALICDVRFPNEADIINEESGLLVRLLRQIDQSEAKAENALNNYDRFSHIIDNSELTVWESCAALYEILKMNGLINEA